MIAIRRNRKRRQTRTVNVAHFSMQFSDGPKQQAADVAKLFARKYAWITGTEAGPEGTLLAQLEAGAKINGYFFHAYKSNWVAVDRSMVSSKTVERGSETVLSNDHIVGPGHDRNIVWLGFDSYDLGRINVMGSHLATHGRPGADRAHSVNVEENAILAHAIGERAKELGAGNALVFYGGDQNIDDSFSDTFFGEPLTSAWDEIGVYESTGNGTIDVIASYNKDGRVSAKYIRALSDRELFMNTDHFPVEAGFNIRLLG